MSPTFYLHTRFYILGRDADFHHVSETWARGLLERVMRGSIHPIAKSWQWEPGGVALFGVVVLNRAGRPRFIERSHLSLHSLSAGRVGVAVSRQWPWLEFAKRVAVELRAPVKNPQAQLLADFLCRSSDRALPSDIARFLHESAPILNETWLLLLEAGRQSHPLWDLRRRTLHPARTSITPPKARSRAS